MNGIATQSPGEREPVFLHRSTSEIFCRIKVSSIRVSLHQTAHPPRTVSELAFAALSIR